MLSQQTAVKYDQMLSQQKAVNQGKMLSQQTAVKHDWMLSQQTAVQHDQTLSQQTAVKHDQTLSQQKAVKQDQTQSQQGSKTRPNAGTTKGTCVNYKPCTLGSQLSYPSDTRKQWHCHHCLSPIGHQFPHCCCTACPCQWRSSKQLEGLDQLTPPLQSLTLDLLHLKHSVCSKSPNWHEQVKLKSQTENLPLLTIFPHQLISNPISPMVIVCACVFPYNTLCKLFW